MTKLALAMIATAALTVSTDQAFASTATRLVVDDDGRQCARAEFASIQAAVDAAQPGSLIRVCPGRYAESVTVTKPLTLKGDLGAVSALDCFQPTLAEVADDQYAAVSPLDDAAPAFALAANDVDLSGFVVQGRLIGVTTSDSFSSYRIHHNMLAGNTEAIRFSTGANAHSRRPSRFDHNCLRENTFGLTNGGALISARIDHNKTYRTAQRAFEAVRVVQDVSFDHNASQLDNNGYLLSGSQRSRIVANTLERVRLGMEIGRLTPNEDLEISGNTFVNVHTGPQPATAIGFNPPSNGLPNTRVVVSANSVTGYTTGIAVGGPPGTVGGVPLTIGSLTDSEVVGNTITDNLQNGIRMRALNTRILVRDNILTANGWHGIHAACGLISGTTTEVCPAGNRFVANEMLGNGLYDGRDDTGIAPGGTRRQLQNTWIANRCETDVPEGAICPTE